MKKIFNKTNIKIFVFVVYIILNIILLINHEPWRDEARAWLMARNLNIKELFVVSKFDGHPILWHLILMPFAKLGFPYITIQIINLVICLIAAYIFYFKIKINDIIKTFILFGAPFIYVYTTIARNYCLILLFAMLLFYIYEKRHIYPCKYIFVLALLLNCPTMCWGLSITMYIFFAYEFFSKKIHTKEKIQFSECIPFIIYILTLILVTVELSGTTNSDFPKAFSTLFMNYTFMVLNVIVFSIFGVSSFFTANKWLKEYIICVVALCHQIIITVFFYPYLLEQRIFYQCIVWLGYIIIVYPKMKKKYKSFLSIIYIMTFITFSFKSYHYVKVDMEMDYSSAKRTAIWINKNIDENELLIDKSIFCQSIVPYLKKNIRLYDVYYEKYFDDLKVYSHEQEDKEIELKNYSGKYIIVSLEFDANKNEDILELVYESHESIKGEDFRIYKIK